MNTRNIISINRSHQRGRYFNLIERLLLIAKAAQKAHDARVDADSSAFAMWSDVTYIHINNLPPQLADTLNKADCQSTGMRKIASVAKELAKELEASNKKHSRLTRYVLKRRSLDAKSA